MPTCVIRDDYIKKDNFPALNTTLCDRPWKWRTHLIYSRPNAQVWSLTKNVKKFQQNFLHIRNKKVKILCFFLPELYNFLWKVSVIDVVFNPWSHHKLWNGAHRKFDSFRLALCYMKYVLFGGKFRCSMLTPLWCIFASFSARHS